MKRLVLILTVMAVLVPTSLWAQDNKADIFGGFSILSLSDSVDRTTAPGWQAAVSGNVTPMFSIVGDFGGQYKDGGNAMEYLFGPRATHRTDKASVFGHALFGGTHFSDGGGNHFTMAYGGGVDVNAGDKMAVRVVQFDWMPIKNGGTGGGWTKNSIRLGFGVVFKIGS